MTGVAVSSPIFGQGGAPFYVGVADSITLGACQKQLRGKFPNSLEHVVARLSAYFGFKPHQTLIDQGREIADEISVRSSDRFHNGIGGLEGEAADEHAQPTKEPLF